MLMLVSPGSLVPPKHPLRGIKTLADDALRALDATFSEMYSNVGRPSVPPVRMLKTLLLMVLYSIRRERQVCEQLQYNMLFRWFVDMDLTEPAFDPSSFSKNRERLIEHDVASTLSGMLRSRCSTKASQAPSASASLPTRARTRTASSRSCER